jgi:hypothetical protein
LTQVTLRGLMVVVAEAALACALLAHVDRGELYALLALFPLLAALWNGLRARWPFVGAFRGAVFAGALQAAIFVMAQIGLLFTGRSFFPTVGPPSLEESVYLTGVVLLSSLFLGVFVGVLVGLALNLVAPPARRDSDAVGSRN